MRPIDSISASRKLDCAVSSSSTTSCRRRSVTIRCSAKAAPPTIATPSPTNARPPEPTATLIRARIAAAATTPTRSAALVDDRVTERDRNRVGAGVGLELREDVAHVALHRLLANEEPAGHVRVRHPVGEQLQDLALPGGQHVLLVPREERGHQRRVDEALAGDDLVDR